MNKVDKNKLIRVEIKEKNIDDFIKYFNKIKEEMEHHEFLMNISKEYLLRMLKNNSHIFAYIYDEMVICCAMILPCDKKAIELSGLNLDYREVLEYGIQFVHPNYRGNHLQYYMIDDIRYYALAKGFKYAIGVVNKDNEYSNNNAKKWGKLIKEIKLDGKINNVYYNDLSYKEKEKINIKELKREVLKKEDLVYYINYLNRIRDNMKHPDFLGLFEKDELEKLLENNSYIYIYKYKDDIVSSSMIIPSTKKDLESFGIDLDYREVVDYGQQVVSDKYRGNGLQQYMLEELEIISKEKGYKYAVTTVHPDNIYSINNTLKNNFELIGSKEFDRGPRNIYLKKL